MVGLPLALIAQQCARPWTRVVVMRDCKRPVLVVKECEVIYCLFGWCSLASTLIDGNSTLANRFNANEEENQYNGVVMVCHQAE